MKLVEEIAIVELNAVPPVELAVSFQAIVVFK